MRHLGVYAVFALIAGCTGGGSPGERSVSATAAPTPVPTIASTVTISTMPTTPTVPADVPTSGPNADRDERPPVMPIAATRHTPAGARAFAVFFVKTIDWAYATTSTTYMRHYFDDSCVECRSVADAIDRDRKRHHHFIGGRFTIHRIESAPDPESSGVTLILKIESVEIVTANNRYVGAERAHTALREVVRPAWRSDGWLVLQMEPQ